MEKDVHTEHCCLKHGCKYCDKNCTVTTKQKLQSFPCEACGDEAKSLKVFEAIVKAVEERTKAVENLKFRDAASADRLDKAESELEKLKQRFLENYNSFEDICF